jgi:uncharacterized protein (TIGR02117 family)
LPVVQDSPGYGVYVVSHGKHAGLVIKRADIPAIMVPEKADFPYADYLEIGWGEIDYYPAEAPGLWLTLKAALWPTASVLHVVGIHGAPASAFAGLEMVRLDLDQRAWLKLIRYIHASFARGSAHKAKPLQRGLYGDSGFYPAVGKFHLFNTCNDWIAEGLEFAGLQLRGIDPFTSGQLMTRLKRLGAVEVGAGLD